jgi:hypothetical protein
MEGQPVIDRNPALIRSLRYRLLRWGLVLLALGLMASEFQASRIPGIECLIENPDASISAYTLSRQYTSKDGGITWDTVQPSDTDNVYLQLKNTCRAFQASYDARIAPWTLKDPHHQNVVYIFIPRQDQILRSEDNGVSWREEDFNSFRAEAVFGYEGVWISDALFHTVSGNLVVAIDVGVLVRTPDGSWQWVAVGPHQLRAVDTLDDVFFLLLPEITLALSLAFLAQPIVGLFMGKAHKAGIVLTVLASSMWIFSSFVARMVWDYFDPLYYPGQLLPFLLLLTLIAAAVIAHRRSYLPAAQNTTVKTVIIVALVYLSALFPFLTGLSGMGIAFFLFWAVIFAVVVYMIVGWSSLLTRTLRPSNATGAAALLAYLTPLILWSQNIIPHYQTMAWPLAMTLVAIILALSAILYRRRVKAAENA